MKAMNWNEYVELCEMNAAKRKAARKLFRDKYPTFCKVMDIIADIMMIASFIIFVYCCITAAAAKVRQIKMITAKAVDAINSIANKAKTDDENAKACPDEVESEEVIA